MKTRMTQTELTHYVVKQLQQFFPDNKSVTSGVAQVIGAALERVEASFSRIKSRYYRQNDDVFFNHLNTDHYAAFLYLLSNELYRQRFEPVAEKVFALNKALHGLDAFYAVELPEVFLLVHPLGTVLGNADYSDRLVVYQNVTVGSDIDGIYPQFGEGCVLYSGVSAIGNVQTGSCCVFGANTFVKGVKVPDDSTVVGSYPDTKIVSGSNELISHYFY